MKHFAIAMLFAASTSAAAAETIEVGRAFAEANCARCHAISHEDASPNPRSIPFRFIGRLYPIEGLEEALAEGIYASHEMPEFELSVEEVTGLIAYLHSVQVRAE